MLSPTVRTWREIPRQDRGSPAAGEIVADHYVAPLGADYWGEKWLYFAEHQVVGDTLYVLDHPHRLVEVDIDRIGESDTAAWQDPGVGPAVVLDLG